LFYLVTAAVRAGGLFRVMLCDGQNLRECFLAGVTDELVVGHTDLPRSLNGYDWILDPWRLTRISAPPSKRLCPDVALFLRRLALTRPTRSLQESAAADCLPGGRALELSVPFSPKTGLPTGGRRNPGMRESTSTIPSFSTPIISTNNSKSLP
jgi:hypothetical protein